MSNQRFQNFRKFYSEFHEEMGEEFSHDIAMAQAYIAPEGMGHKDLKDNKLSEKIDLFFFAIDEGQNSLAKRALDEINTELKAIKGHISVKKVDSFTEARYKEEHDKAVASHLGVMNGKTAAYQMIDDIKLYAKAKAMNPDDASLANNLANSYDVFKSMLPADQQKAGTSMQTAYDALSESYKGIASDFEGYKELKSISKQLGSYSLVEGSPGSQQDSVFHTDGIVVVMENGGFVKYLQDRPEIFGDLKKDVLEEGFEASLKQRVTELKAKVDANINSQEAGKYDYKTAQTELTQITTDLKQAALEAKDKYYLVAEEYFNEERALLEQLQLDVGTENENNSSVLDYLNNNEHFDSIIKRSHPDYRLGAVNAVIGNARKLINGYTPEQIQKAYLSVYPGEAYKHEQAAPLAKGLADKDNASDKVTASPPQEPVADKADEKPQKEAKAAEASKGLEKPLAEEAEKNKVATSKEVSSTVKSASKSFRDHFNDKAMDGAFGSKRVFAYEESTKLVQEALIDAGFDPGKVDGLEGPLTRGGIQQYADAAGYSQDEIKAMTVQTLLNKITEYSENQKLERDTQIIVPKNPFDTGIANDDALSRQLAGFLGMHEDFANVEIQTQIKEEFNTPVVVPADSLEP